jgi:uncharacterized protein Yka (UPF0111/DUF47 family)
MLLYGIIPLLQKIFRLMISFLRIAKKRPAKTEVRKNDSLESLVKENQRLEQENDLLYLQHLKTLIGMKTEIGR